MLVTLIRSLTKAEKRNFKLYVKRLGASTVNAKFVALYDAIEGSEGFDHDKILAQHPEISKTQLPNLKAHLYRQILLSLSGLYSALDRVGEIRQMIAFAHILVDKGMASQSAKMLDKAKELALEFQFYTLALEIVEFEKRLELMHMSRSTNARVDALSRLSIMLLQKISNINELSNLAIQLSNLNLQLGYARSEKDKTLIISRFRLRIERFEAMTNEMDFHEKLYLFQCQMWYSFIQYDFVRCYRWAMRLMSLFDGNNTFKQLYFDIYIRGYSRLLDVMFMTRQLGPLEEFIDRLEYESGVVLPRSNKAQVTTELTLLLSMTNMHFLRGDFEQGLHLVERVDRFIDNHGDYIEQHYKMLLYYKVACLYFGSEDYRGCTRYLQKIITVKNPSFRRDLQVFARILNLIASYEAGDDETLESQVRSVYAFVVKINDMHAVQRAIISFLRRIPHTYAGDFKAELQKLYDELKPLENHPYQRRPFFYLDIISYLESKLSGVSITEIRKRKITPSR